MKHYRSIYLAAIVAAGTVGIAQGVPPIDHIVIKDPRIFDISDDGAGYGLMDGPVATAQLNLVHGPNGTLAGTVFIQDDALHTWGPINVSGKLAVKGTLPLSITLAGGGGGQAKVKIAGNYDASLSLMRVIVQVSTPEKLKFQWNDSFVPFWAHTLGVRLDRMDVVKNGKGILTGATAFYPPIAGSPVVVSTTVDRELRNDGFVVKTKGANISGSYNDATTSFSVTNSKVNVGYGAFFTAGSLVDVTSDNYFTRNY